MSRFSQSANSDRIATMRIGIYLLGLATLAAGILDLIWGEFDPGHQPIQSLGKHIPGQSIFAYIAATWLIVAGGALLSQRTIRKGAWATAGIYFIFGLFALPRFYTVPRTSGFHPLLLIPGVVATMLAQFIVVAGCLLVDASFAPTHSDWRHKSQVLARWIFGLSGVLFGLAHFTFTKPLARMIPKWFPVSGSFWVVISGAGFMLAGIAILTGLANVLAARLLTLMLILFEIALIPIVFGFPHVHQAWGASAYNLAVAGAVWIFAASISRRDARAQETGALYHDRSTTENPKGDPEEVAARL